MQAASIPGMFHGGSRPGAAGGLKSGMMGGGGDRGPFGGLEFMRTFKFGGGGNCSSPLGAWPRAAGGIMRI